MKIGYIIHPRKDVIKRIEWIGKHKFDFVDLFLEEDIAVPEKINIAQVKSILKKYNLSAVGHTAWYLPIGSPIKLIRECAIKEAERYFKIFRQLKVEYVTIHAFWPPSIFSDNEGVEYQIETLKKLVKISRNYNLRLMYEPIDTERDNLKNVSKILSNVSELYFHLDIGHANLYKKKINDFIKKFHKKLVHIHLHDNHGKEDEHLPLGKGNIDIEKVIRELRKYDYDGTITLEIFKGNNKDLLRSKDKLRKLWNSE
ncbi:sugar phosphate isomerase/epimerase [Candidatus Pacearchaeota archaeon]|nr:sugar phosphate isomerase/epimerase [Candidatus Pacearchaeota archaeon]